MTTSELILLRYFHPSRNEVLDDFMVRWDSLGFWQLQPRRRNHHLSALPIHPVSTRDLRHSEQKIKQNSPRSKFVLGRTHSSLPVQWGELDTCRSNRNVSFSALENTEDRCTEASRGCLNGSRG